MLASVLQRLERLYVMKCHAMKMIMMKHAMKMVQRRMNFLIIGLKLEINKCFLLAREYGY